MYTLFMPSLNQARRAAVAIVLGLLFSGRGVNAAEVNFSVALTGLSFQAASFDANRNTALAPVPSTPAPASASGAKVYGFKTLYTGLGYPSPTFFGSSEAELLDLESYTSKQDAFYAEINGYLRFYPAPYDWYGTGPEDAKGIVANIDRIFTRTPALPADLILFRGLDLKFRAGKPYAVNEEFIDKGYVSTSVSYKVAEYFTTIGDDKGKNSGKAVFVIYSNRPGEKGILIDQGEDEVILGHGLKFRAMASRNTGKGYDLYLVQACAKTCDAAIKETVRVFWAGFKP